MNTPNPSRGGTNRAHSTPDHLLTSKSSDSLAGRIERYEPAMVAIPVRPGCETTSLSHPEQLLDPRRRRTMTLQQLVEEHLLRGCRHATPKSFSAGGCWVGCGGPVSRVRGGGYSRAFWRAASPDWATKRRTVSLRQACMTRPAA